MFVCLFQLTADDIHNYFQTSDSKITKTITGYSVSRSYIVIEYIKTPETPRVFLECTQIAGKAIHFTETESEIHNILKTSRTIVYTRFDHLNEDVLIVVCDLFSMNELCTVADVDSQLRTAARSTFRRAHTNSSGDVEFRLNEGYSELECIQIMRIFGREINFLKIEANANIPNSFLEILCRYPMDNLKKIKLAGLTLSDRFDLRNLFEKLEEIYIDSCNGTLLNLLASCQNAHSLHLSSILFERQIITETLQHRFPKLRNVGFKGIVDLPEASLLHFLRINPNLIKIRVPTVGDNIFTTLLTHSPNMREMHIEFVDNMSIAPNLQDFRQLECIGLYTVTERDQRIFHQMLSSVRVLQINKLTLDDVYLNEQHTHLMTSLRQLESITFGHLELHGIRIIGIVREQNIIKEINLTDCIVITEDIIALIRKSPLLKDIQASNISINDQTFDGILNILSARHENIPNISHRSMCHANVWKEIDIA